LPRDIGQFEIHGAVDLALFDGTGDAKCRASAIQHLETAVEHWKRYATAYARQNVQPVLYNRTGWVDIPGLIEKAMEDVDIARTWKAGTIQGPVRHGADVPFRQ